MRQLLSSTSALFGQPELPNLPGLLPIWQDFLQTHPTCRVFKKSKSPWFPQILRVVGPEKGQKSSSDAAGHRSHLLEFAADATAEEV